MSGDCQQMRILLGYSHYRSEVDVRKRIQDWLARLRTQGIMCDDFCLTLKPPGPRLGWRELDRRWRRGDRELLTLYEDLARRAEYYDVFVNYNGINVHPGFLRTLSTFNVYGCFDDPESSDDLSRPVACAYDLAMVGNIAALDMYRAWGVREVRFWPLGFRAGEYDPRLTRERILTDKRDVEVTLLCERLSTWRHERLDEFSAAFPHGAYYGAGWPNGFLPEERRVPLYQRTRIGVNFHNSTGPINSRTYALPANGVMQICDNKSHLGQIFELNKEVVGFDTVEEAIDLCRYYLSHEDERRQIAAAGWERALKDYNEAAMFRLMMSYVDTLRPVSQNARRDVAFSVRSHRMRTIPRRIMYHPSGFLRAINARIRALLFYLIRAIHAR